MKKAYLILAAITSVTLFSCTNDEFVGNSPGTTDQSYGNEIAFGSKAGKITRATQNTGTVAEMLDGQFMVYGVKNMTTAWGDVFQNYVVWSSNDKTATNPDVATAGDRNGWEYVGTTAQTYGADNTHLAKQQYVKYWDYSSPNYHFIAVSPAKHLKAVTLDGTTKDITSATITGIAGHITANSTTTAINTDPVYIADPVNVVKDNGDYNKEVTFSFTRQQTFVRVGVFETIPGYSISAISFYQYDETTGAWTTTKSNNITLASEAANYFRGASNATVTVTYDWTAATPTYSYAYASGLTQSNNWFGGALTGVQATTSTESDVAKLYGTDGDMATTSGYFPVIPTDVATAQPILIKCDYTLKSLDGSNEEINVKGATAAIPAAFTLWKPNTSYTYLFKISPNTNGTTGDPNNNNDPEGLYPITFDATVIAEADGTAQGTITTVTTPSITTYQEGSVTPTGIKYVKEKAIYFTAQNDETGALNPLSALNDGSPAVGMVKVYSVAAGSTEADLILTRPTTGVETTIGAANKTINGQDIGSGKWASFTPTATGTYAIEYVTATTTPAYSYKIIVVE